ncbi:flagellar export chaperone FliS [Brevibacillus choshinensis]|uniref:flagellar export chaperone FliS n=1 Tax=Brevibacillus choshinensis TaxID=54911 RepID=UPI002E235730|nr:flagellar export chaperone FliS [Brevibacillus choshinensis]MED4586187.1 flagellar export chaperone FliS [Brevibacillus choshinensis]
MYQSAAQTYQNNQVTTATPAELTLMLYNGAIKFIKQTRTSIQNRELERANEYSKRVQDILQELIVTLNKDYPLAEQMMRLYEFMLSRLVESNIKKDVAILDEVEGLFVQFRDTWKEAMLLAKKEA